ncbi:cysteine--tRNA ligase [Candidatus Peregrinibacteria bacterium]|nr:cysteine--tRNA ligase [Candidatus Peregrinibacteria bacterium]
MAGGERLPSDAREEHHEQAKEEKTDPLSIARKYTEQYLEDEHALNMLEPFARPRASETIPEMIAIIQTLIAKGNAYEAADGVYFSVETFPQYGALSGNALANLDAGARVKVKEEKRHPADFALWKKTVGENALHILRWPSPWGEGFPGWHIECSAMSRKFLGPKLDIHTGGEDNIFPHHECEIAQSECSGGSPFVRFWLHRRRIDLGEAKMSKSLGNILSLPDLAAKGYDPLDLRYLLLSVHYRTPLKFTWEGLDAARRARRTIVDWMEREGSGEYASADVHHQTFLPEDVAEFDRQFNEAMDSDLNTSAALAALFSCLHQANTCAPPSGSMKDVLRSFIAKVRTTFGCFEPEGKIEIPPDIQSLLDERAAARLRKDFAASDRLRREIEAKGFILNDTKNGMRMTKK